MPEVGLRKWIVTITIVTGVLLEIIDSTVVNVALPNIIGSLGATLADAGWIVTGYTLANVIVLPISGWLGNRFGRKKYFLVSIIVFTAASFLCGNATSLTELIVFRLLQGLAGGGLLSNGQTILLETWPKEEIGIGTAIFGIGVMVGPAIGPTLGGYIVDHLAWPWIFYVNLPVGILAAFLVFTFIKESSLHGTEEPIDWWGILLLMVTVGSLQVVLEKGQGEDWFETGYIVVLSATAVIAGICFVWRELVIEYPIVNFSIFRHRSFLFGNITMFFLGLILYCSMFAFPLFCQNILRLTAQQTGMLMIPSTVVSMVVMPVVGVLQKKGVPGQLLGALGPVMFILCFFIMSGTTIDTGAGYFFWPMMILGIGRAFMFVPFTALAMQDLEGKEIGQGTGINNLMRQLGGTFGVAIFATLLQVQTNAYRNILIENVNPFNPAFQDRFHAAAAGFAAKGYSSDIAQGLSLKAIEGVVMTQAQLLTYNHIYAITAVMLLVCIPLFLLQKSNKKTAAQEGIPSTGSRTAG